jgi:hypothetical protein
MPDRLRHDDKNKIPERNNFHPPKAVRLFLPGIRPGKKYQVDPVNPV